MIKNTILVTFLLTATNNFAQQKDAPFINADHYQTSTFDVAIFPGIYNDEMTEGKTFTPTREEIDKAESALQHKLRELNKMLINQSSSPVIHKNLGKYKRQYFGYIDKNGNRVLRINSFWSEGNDESGWLHQRYMVFDGGSYYWNVKFNPDTGVLFDLYINGYA